MATVARLASHDLRPSHSERAPRCKATEDPGQCAHDLRPGPPQPSRSSNSRTSSSSRYVAAWICAASSVISDSISCRFRGDCACRSMAAEGMSRLHFNTVLVYSLRAIIANENNSISGAEIKGRPISEAVSIGKTRLWRLFRTSRFHLTGLQHLRALLCSGSDARLRRAPVTHRDHSDQFQVSLVPPEREMNRKLTQIRVCKFPSLYYLFPD